MKISFPHRPKLLFGLVALLALTSRSHAQFGVAIVADAPREIQWMQESMLWSEANGYAGKTAANTQMLVRNTEQLVQNTNDLLERLGRTTNAVSQVSRSIPASTASLKTAVTLETRVDTLKTASQRYSINQVPLRDDNNEMYAVGATYDAFKESQKRDTGRYRTFAAQQAMNDRFQTAVANAEKVETEELAIQDEAIKQLKNATTEAEIEVCNLAVDASKGRLDLAHAKVNQARAEMDEYLTKVSIEKERKAEADREWTEAVVAGLRTRALNAYKAQSGVSDDRTGT